jgi:thiamine-phosphate pyrophosphorylase
MASAYSKETLGSGQALGPRRPGNSMTAKRARRLNVLRGAGLYLVTDDRLERTARRRILEATLSVGVLVVQLRDKQASARALYDEAADLAILCQRHGAILIVNDRADVAVASGADGVHVGQDDLPADRARAIVGPDLLLGVSASTVEEAVDVDRSGADYLGYGAMFPTPTKSDAEYAGPAMLAVVKRRVRLPVVAIGGITALNMSEVLAAGADLVAVVSAVFGAADPPRAAADLLAAMTAARD